MTPLERTTLVSSGLTRPRRCCARPPARCPAVPYGPGAARPPGRPVTSAAVCPARGGGVLIVLPSWLRLLHAPRPDATGFTSFFCGIGRVKLPGPGAALGAALGWPAAPDRPGGGGK